MSETPWPARGCELYGHRYYGKRPCGACGAPYVELTELERRIAGAVKYSLPDQAGRDQSAEDLARRVSRALGLKQEWSDDIAGPNWCRYSRWVTETTVHHGPAYHQGEACNCPPSTAAGLVIECPVHDASANE